MYVYTKIVTSLCDRTRTSDDLQPSLSTLCFTLHLAVTSSNMAADSSYIPELEAELIKWFREDPIFKDVILVMGRDYPDLSTISL